MKIPPAIDNNNGGNFKWFQMLQKWKTKKRQKLLLKIFSSTLLALKVVKLRLFSSHKNVTILNSILCFSSKFKLTEVKRRTTTMMWRQHWKVRINTRKSDIVCTQDVIEMLCWMEGKLPKDICKKCRLFAFSFRRNLLDFYPHFHQNSKH